MRQLFFILMISYASLVYGQDKCILKLESSTASLQTKGIVEISVINAGTKKVKINKHYSPYRLQLENIRENTNSGENKIRYIADVDCFTDCIRKTVKLRPGEKYMYTIPIKETIQYTKLLNGRNYTFHFFFDLIDLTPENCKISKPADEEISYTKTDHQ